MIYDPDKRITAEDALMHPAFNFIRKMMTRYSSPEVFRYCIDGPPVVMKCPQSRHFVFFGKISRPHEEISKTLTRSRMEAAKRIQKYNGSRRVPEIFRVRKMMLPSILTGRY